MLLANIRKAGSVCVKVSKLAVGGTDREVEKNLGGSSFPIP